MLRINRPAGDAHGWEPPVSRSALFLTRQPPLGALALELHHAAVEAALLHQFRRGALLGHMAVFQHHDVVGSCHGAHPVGNDQHRLALKQTGEGGLDGAFVLHVQAGGGLIQQHHRRVLQQGPGDGDPDVYKRQALFGGNMKDGSIGKISENRFARADLEDILLCVDDDMRMEALRQTNYVKSIVTAQGKMDLERKGRQSYQGWMFARLLAFSNGDLQSLFDRSDGFYRRQLVLTTRERPAGRVDDPDLAEKMKAEVEGIFLWAFEGLRRLVSNNFKFTESQRTRANREAVKRDNNNVFDFLESEGYIRLRADASISSKELYEVYQVYCAENGLTAMKPRSFSDVVIASQGKYHLEYCNNVTNAAGRRVRGFWGIEALVHPNISVFSSDSLRTYVPRDTPEG